jgi:hypothetical protein
MQIWRTAVAACAVALGIPSAALADDVYKALTAKLATLDLGKGIELVDSRAGKTYRSLYDECDAHNTFGGKSLPTTKNGPERCSTDPNQVAFIRKFPDGTIVFRSKMAVDADGSPASKGKNKSNSDQSNTSLNFGGTPTEFVNAEEISFVVMPQTKDYDAAFAADSGVGLGDLALIMKDGSCSFGIVADNGPAFRLGEASIKAHEDLGNHQCSTPGQHPCLKILRKGRVSESLQA